MIAAAHEGHVRSLLWVRSNGFPWNVMTCINSAGGEHLGVCSGRGLMVVSGVILHVIGLAPEEAPMLWSGRGRAVVLARGVFYKTAFKGHVSVLQWMRSTGCYRDEKTCVKAVLGVSKFFRRPGRTAARGTGHLRRCCRNAAPPHSFIQWARSNVFSVEVSRLAARLLQRG